MKCIYRRGREELPARGEEVHHAEQEGIQFFFLHSPLRFIGDENGWLKQVELQEMRLGEPDDSGRRRPEPVPGSVQKIDCDLAIIAVGSGANPLITATTQNLAVNKWGYIDADEENGKTKKPKVWAEAISSPVRPPYPGRRRGQEGRRLHSRIPYLGLVGRDLGPCKRANPNIKPGKPFSLPEKGFPILFAPHRHKCTTKDRTENRCNR